MDHSTQENGGQSGDAYDPRDALADVDGSRGAVADRLVTPWWYHPALGLAMGALILVNALALPTAVTIVVALLAAAAVGALVGAYTRLTGLWVDPRTAGPRARAWWLGYAAVLVVAVVVALLPTVTDVRFPAWAAVLLAAAVVVATIVLGRKIDATLREEIRSGAAPIPAKA